jgi:HPt (histidine-containing phosphotransfer) domain-containing protein
MARRDLTGAVDFGRLEAMTAGDVVVMEEILNIFRQQAEVWEPLLDVASPGWRDAAHTVKGASASIGADALAAACLEAEAAPDALATPALERVKDQLAIALGDVAAFAHELALRSLKA